jgi:hypothetical protein
MNAQLLEALFAAIRNSRTGMIQMDDITESGKLALDPAGNPNAAQNGLGHVPSWASKRGWLVNTKRSVKSDSPRRNGGRQLLWRITPAGYAAAGAPVPGRAACLFCDADPDSEPMAAEWVVADYELCLAHALSELNEIMTSPDSFVHSWPTGPDRLDWGEAVPFVIEVRMIEQK